MKKTLVLMSLLLGVTCAKADTMNPEDSVEYRQSAFRLMSFQLNVLNPMHRSQAYSEEEFAYRADLLSRLGRLAHEGFTDASRQVDSRTASRMWDNREDFDQRMQTFIDVTAQMAQSSEAGNDRQTRDLFRQTLQSCRSCHDQYRLD